MSGTQRRPLIIDTAQGERLLIPCESAETSSRLLPSVMRDVASGQICRLRWRDDFDLNAGERWAFERYLCRVVRRANPEASPRLIDHATTPCGRRVELHRPTEGCRIVDWLGAVGVPGLRDIVRVVLQLARTLRHPHLGGLGTGDISPDHIWLEPGPFGLEARITAPNEATGLGGGSRPEDLHRLGALAAAMCRLHQWSELEELGETQSMSGIHFRPRLPASIQGWLDRAAAADPADRFGTVRRMTRALSLAAHAEGLEIEPGLDELYDMPGRYTSLDGRAVRRDVPSIR